MGMYDEFGDNRIQLKIGPCDLSHYRIGMTVPVDDGIYIAYEGAVVVKDGKLVATDLKLFDKWGKLIEPGEYIENRNPVSRVLIDFFSKEDKK